MLSLFGLVTMLLTLDAMNVPRSRMSLSLRIDFGSTFDEDVLLI